MSQRRRQRADEPDALRHAPAIAEENAWPLGDEGFTNPSCHDPGPIARILDETSGDGVRDQVGELIEDVVRVIELDDARRFGGPEVFDTADERDLTTTGAIASATRGRLRCGAIAGGSGFVAKDDRAGRQGAT